MTAKRKALLRSPLAVRAFMKHPGKARVPHASLSALGWPSEALVFDTETTIDSSQRLLFGSYQYCREIAGEYVCVEEGIFYADELPVEDPRGFHRLSAYAESHRANIGADGSRTIRFLSRHDFIRKVFFPASCRAEALVCGFNLPFDLSRVAVESGVGRRWYYGGFSLALADYPKGKKRIEDTYFARVNAKPIDSKRAFVGFSGGREPHKGQGVRGRFLDLRALAFALTNAGHSLASACTAFGVPVGKGYTTQHGKITNAYIAYNRQDVTASRGLLNALRQEFDRHPIALDPCKAYSPASVAKAYLDALGIARPADQFSDIAPKYLGYAMTAYFGGRAEVRIRNTVVPVVYTDFLSMYPTVNALMGLFDVLTADRLEIQDAAADVRKMLATVTAECVFNPALWRGLCWFAQIRPNGDVLPARATYSNETDAWNIGVNPVTSKSPLWYAGPDIIASTLLTGKSPDIIRAFRIIPLGKQKTLATVALRGQIEIDPSEVDFFCALIEERKSLTGRSHLSADERARLGQFLKVLANAGSYGVFAEMNAVDRPKKSKLQHMNLFGIEHVSDHKTQSPEELGRFCFPILAALIPAGARLMLALLERTVTDRGGRYALCDTDSMAIVANEAGGLVECAGGTARTPEGTTAIRALSWADVDAISVQFRALSPYNPDVIRGSILKIEDENFRAKRQRQLYAYAISAKRYALFARSKAGRLTIVKKSEHGLGHLLNPSNPDSGRTDWIADSWKFIIANAIGIPAHEPAWLDRPAMSRVTLSSPHLYRPFADDSRPYRARVKPFNFALSAQVAPFGHLAGVDPKRFHLVAPYERDARTWLRLTWMDVHTGAAYAIATGPGVSTRTVRVKSYRDVLAEHCGHPEAKGAAPDGGPCARDTDGLLGRRAVECTSIVYVGKESNRVEEVEHGLVHDWDDVQHVYFVSRAPVHEMRARMKRVPVRALATRARLSARQVLRIRAGRSNPTLETTVRLERALTKLLVARA